MILLMKKMRICLYIKFIYLCNYFLYLYVYGKNDFAKIFKNLARSKNNFVGLSKIERLSVDDNTAKILTF